MGSSYFFDKIDGFKSKDIDLLCIMDDFGKIKSNVLNLKADGKDIFFFRDMDKEGFIKDTLESVTPMRFCKFLIPEFCEYIGFTVDDLIVFKDLVEKIDEKHQYTKLIYEYYLENKSFALTDEQLKKVYEEYLKTH